jgi:ribonuclease D
LLSDSAVLKVFHHALFDLRFMCSHWKVEAKNIGCTKIASKIRHRDWDPAAHSLKPLLQSRLGVILDKAEQVSDWFVPTLSPEQVAYAVSDVLHLVPLLDALRDDLMRSSQLALAEACFAHIPARVELDLGAYGDVFAY